MYIGNSKPLLKTGMGVQLNYAVSVQPREQTYYWWHSPAAATTVMCGVSLLYFSAPVAAQLSSPMAIFAFCCFCATVPEHDSDHSVNASSHHNIISRVFCEVIINTIGNIHAQ